MKKVGINEGIIPTGLGAIVTGIGATIYNNKHTNKKIKPLVAGITGFGIAHIVLGGIDIALRRK